MDGSGVRTHHRRSLAALAVTSAVATVLTGCMLGGPPDRTDTAAVATPTVPAGEPGPDAQCGEAVYTQGDDKLHPPAAMFRTGFAVPDALEAFDVLCTLTWVELTNDCEMTFSRALIDGGVDGARLPEIDEALTAWATSHGLAQTDIGMTDNTRSYGIDVDASDGGVMTLLQWDAVSRHDGAAEVQRHADLAGIPLDGGDVAVAWQVCPRLQGWETPP